jgi:hypothetical protein
MRGIGASSKKNDMKDLNGLTYSFQEWSALLDFLSNLTRAKVRDIHIAKKTEKEWTMEVREKDTVVSHKSVRGVSLFDLYW